MSSGMFALNWYTDPPWDRVSLEWLMNYIQNIRSNPTLAQTLAANQADFEMVPVPRQIVQHLSDARMETPIGVELSHSVIEREKAKDSEYVMEAVRTLARELESGRRNAAMENVSSAYFDVHGRDSAQLQNDLEKLADTFTSLRIIPVRPNQVSRVGDQIVATVQVAWEGTVRGEATGKRQKQDIANLEVVIEKRGPDQWKIASARTV